MSTVYPLPDWRIEELRERGSLVCRCSTPEPIWLALWQDYECQRCGKAILW